MSKCNYCVQDKLFNHQLMARIVWRAGSIANGSALSALGALNRQNLFPSPAACDFGWGGQGAQVTTKLDDKIDNDESWCVFQMRADKVRVPG